jgi:hypothetical protein
LSNDVYEAISILIQGLACEQLYLKAVVMVIFNSIVYLQDCGPPDRLQELFGIFANSKTLLGDCFFVGDIDAWSLGARDREARQFLINSLQVNVEVMYGNLNHLILLFQSFLGDLGCASEVLLADSINTTLPTKASGYDAGNSSSEREDIEVIGGCC